MRNILPVANDVKEAASRAELAERVRRHVNAPNLLPTLAESVQVWDRSIKGNLTGSQQLIKAYIEVLNAGIFDLYACPCSPHIRHAVALGIKTYCMYVELATIEAGYWEWE